MKSDPLFTTIFGEIPDAAPRAEPRPLPWESTAWNATPTGADNAFVKRVLDRALTAEIVGPMPTAVPRPANPSASSAWAELLGLFDLPATSTTLPATPSTSSVPANRRDELDFTKRQRPMRKTQTEHRKALSVILNKARAAFPPAICDSGGWADVLDSAARFVDESVRLYA